MDTHPCVVRRPSIPQFFQMPPRIFLLHNLCSMVYGGERKKASFAMATPTKPLLLGAFGHLRMAAVALIAGVWRKRTIRQVHDRVAALPLREQSAIVAGVLGLLFGLCLVAAQFGVPGLLVFALLVVLIVN